MATYIQKCAITWRGPDPRPPGRQIIVHPIAKDQTASTCEQRAIRARMKLLILSTTNNIVNSYLSHDSNFRGAAFIPSPEF